MWLSVFRHPDMSSVVLPPLRENHLKGENHIVKETQENTLAEAKGMSPMGSGAPENGEQERNSAAGFAPASGQQGAGLEPQAMNRGRQASCQEQQAADCAQHSPSSEQQSAHRGKPEEAVSPEEQLQAAEAQLAALKQQLYQAEEQRLLRERQLLLTAALQEQLAPVCGREMAEELSRLMCAGADLSANAGTGAKDRTGEAGKEGAEAEENAPLEPRTDGGTPSRRVARLFFRPCLAQGVGAGHPAPACRGL